MTNEVKDKNPKSNIRVKAICLYNLLAFILVVRIFLMGWHANATAGVPTLSVGVFVYLGIIVLFFFSTIALWLKRQWAYIAQLMIYILQLFIIKAGALEFAFYFGPQYVVTFHAPKADVSLGVNIVALVVLVFLVKAKKFFLLNEDMQK